MTAPLSMSTSTDPPRGCGPAWGGPALGPFQLKKRLGGAPTERRTIALNALALA
jgi:hypothetical protein